MAGRDGDPIAVLLRAANTLPDLERCNEPKSNILILIAACIDITTQRMLTCMRMHLRQLNEFVRTIFTELATILVELMCMHNILSYNYLSNYML